MRVPHSEDFPVIIGSIILCNSLSDFRISDIDPAEMLDPTNPTAFVTGLTFTAAGTVTVTQNPIIQNTGGVSVPEPSNLLGLGLLGFGAFLTGKLNKKQAQKDS
jgi:hypothetical protein